MKFPRFVSVVVSLSAFFAPVARPADAPQKPNPDARFANWLYKTPPPATWKRVEKAGALVFAVDLPPGDFCTLTLFPGAPAEADFARQFQNVIDADQKAKGAVKIVADSGNTASKAQEGFDVLTRRLRSETAALNTFHLYLAGHSGGRFDVAAFQTSSEEMWQRYGTEASGFLLSLKLANSLPPEKIAALLGQPAAPKPPPALPGFGDATPAQPPPLAATAKFENPAPAAMKNGVPVGLYFMTRYWSYTQTLEKAAWYFAPDGTVYENLERGFSVADLAAHTGRKGTARFAGNKLEVTWADRKVTSSEVERDAEGFAWDMGSFTPVKPIASAAAVAGLYEGGESLSHGGNKVAVAKRLELHADGTFRWEGVAFASGDTGSTQLYAGATGGATTGTWSASAYSLTLTDTTGHALRGIAFPFDTGKTPGRADHLFFAGIMYQRL